MPKRLFLHVGMPKTGTSSLQVLFAKNIDMLRGAGIEYPQDPAVTQAQVERITSGNGARLARVLTSPETTKRSPHDELARLVSLFDRHDTVLLSSEFLYGVPEAGLRMIASAVRDASGIVDVILFVRHPSESLPSSYLQTVKWGFNGSLDAFLKTEWAEPLLTVVDHIEKFRSVFGPDRVHVRRYRGTGDIFTEVLQILGVGSTAGFDLPSRAINPSPGPAEIALLRRLNVAGFPRLLRRGLNELLGDPLDTPEMAEGVLDAVKETLAAEDARLEAKLQEIDVPAGAYESPPVDYDLTAVSMVAHLSEGERFLMKLVAVLANEVEELHRRLTELGTPRRRV